MPGEGSCIDLIFSDAHFRVLYFVFFWVMDNGFWLAPEGLAETSIPCSSVLMNENCYFLVDWTKFTLPQGSVFVAAAKSRLFTFGSKEWSFFHWPALCKHEPKALDYFKGLCWLYLSCNSRRARISFPRRARRKFYVKINYLHGNLLALKIWKLVIELQKNTLYPSAELQEKLNSLLLDKILLRFELFNFYLTFGPNLTTKL